VFLPNGISFCSTAAAWCTSATDRQTDGQTDTCRTSTGPAEFYCVLYADRDFYAYLLTDVYN